MYKISYSKQALVDLDNAIEFIANDSPENAESYLDGYEKVIELLKNNPFLGVDCRQKQIKRECKILIYKKHLIIYSVDTKSSTIFIIRIFHSSQNYANKVS